VLNIVLKFGAPAQILTDQGSNFLSDLLKNMRKLLKIKRYKLQLFIVKGAIVWKGVIGY
jgi:hypothetical protein